MGKWGRLGSLWRRSVVGLNRGVSGARSRRMCLQVAASLLWFSFGNIFSQSFHFKVFSNSQEGVKFLLSYIDLPVVHEVEDRDQVSVFYSLQI